MRGGPKGALLFFRPPGGGGTRSAASGWKDSVLARRVAMLAWAWAMEFQSVRAES